eukprot:Gb_25137 [translate_table: standard]
MGRREERSPFSPSRGGTGRVAESKGQGPVHGERGRGEGSGGQGRSRSNGGWGVEECERGAKDKGARRAGGTRRRAKRTRSAWGGPSEPFQCLNANTKFRSKLLLSTGREEATCSPSQIRLKSTTTSRQEMHPFLCVFIVSSFSFHLFGRQMARIGAQEASGDGENGRLVQMCIDAACKSKKAVEVWRRQKRTLERMPNHLAGPLFHCLLKRGLLTPPFLECSFQANIRDVFLTTRLYRVFQQSVEEVNLKGEISVGAEWIAYLGAYRHLRVLHLADCKAVNSSALWNLTGMTTLEELDLSRCSKITDAGIGHLLSLPSLKKLSLSETGIKADGVARLSVITSLTSLDLGGLPVSNSAVSSLQIRLYFEVKRSYTEVCTVNVIAFKLKLRFGKFVCKSKHLVDTGQILSILTLLCLQTLTQLQFLDMWGSKITNEGTALLKAFVHLNFLNLAWTNVTRVPELFSLTSLNMSKCTIDSIFEGLAKQKTSLLRLHFAGAIFTDAYHVFSCLGTHNLNFLDLSGSPLDDVSFLAAMNRLEFLDLSSTGVTDSSVKSVADIGANLKQLNLSNTRISSDAIAILAGNVPKLECISLSHTVVGDNVLTYLSRMPALRSISLSHTNIKGFIYVGECDSNPTFSLVALQQLEYLEILDLENTHVSDLACKPLSFLKELCHLSLRSDFLSDISLHTVSSLPKLKFLSIKGAVVTSQGLCSFIPPPLLQILDLRDCWLLAEDGIVEFCQAHPRLELRHELITGISKDQAHFSRGQMHSHATVEASRGRRGRKLGTSSSSLTTRENSTQRRFVDERIKYSTSELLHIQASPRSALSLLDIGISLPASLERK